MSFQTNMGTVRTHLVDRPGQDLRVAPPPPASTLRTPVPVELVELQATVAQLTTRVAALEAAQLSARLRRAWAWVVAQYRWTTRFWGAT